MDPMKESNLAHCVERYKTLERTASGILLGRNEPQTDYLIEEVQRRCAYVRSNRIPMDAKVIECFSKAIAYRKRARELLQKDETWIEGSKKDIDHQDYIVKLEQICAAWQSIPLPDLSTQQSVHQVPEQDRIRSTKDQALSVLSAVPLSALPTESQASPSDSQHISVSKRVAEVEIGASSAMQVGCQTTTVGQTEGDALAVKPVMTAPMIVTTNRDRLPGTKSIAVRNLQTGKTFFVIPELIRPRNPLFEHRNQSDIPAINMDLHDWSFGKLLEFWLMRHIHGDSTLVDPSSWTITQYANFCLTVTQFRDMRILPILLNNLAIGKEAIRNLDFFDDYLIDVDRKGFGEWENLRLCLLATRILRKLMQLVETYDSPDTHAFCLLEFVYQKARTRVEALLSQVDRRYDTLAELFTDALLRGSKNHGIGIGPVNITQSVLPNGQLKLSVRVTNKSCCQ